MLIYANPTATKPRAARRRAAPGASTMKKRTTKRRAVSRRRVHRNPAPVATRRRRVHRNPSLAGRFGVARGSVLGELLSVEGAMMIGAGLVAPTAAAWVQAKVMPSATGWVKLGIQAAVVLGGAYAIDKYGKQRKAALAFALTGTSALIADAINLGRAKATGVSDSLADYLVQNPSLINAAADGRDQAMGDYFEPSLSDGFNPMAAMEGSAFA